MLLLRKIVSPRIIDFKGAKKDTPNDSSLDIKMFLLSLVAIIQTVILKFYRQRMHTHIQTANLYSKHA